jgi:hypothetical protein
VKESSLMWPLLTRDNYSEWAMLMQCNFEALEIWDVISPGINPKRAHDRQAMSVLLRSVPKEMWQSLSARPTLKEAWEAVKLMRLGADRVKEVNAKKLLQEFENIKFKDGESVEDFGMRITNLVGNLRALGEIVEDVRVVKKFLCMVPARFTQVVVTIEMFCDLKQLSVDELVGRLRAAEDRFDDKIEHLVDKTGCLLLAEVQWLEKHKHRLRGSHHDGGGNSGVSFPKTKMSSRHEGSNSGQVKLTYEGTPRRKGRCRNCGIYGHWAEDCKRPKKGRKKEVPALEANVAVGGADHPGALMLATCDVVHRHDQHVHLSQGTTPISMSDDMWVLDTGASNHMTGSRSTLTQIGSNVQGTVRLGDGSRVKIQGMGSVVMQDQSRGHKVLTDMYYIPEMKCNIVSLGQLEEKALNMKEKMGNCVFMIKNGNY